MAFEDYLEPEVAVAAAVTAAVFSPRARRLLRKGAVYGVAGALVAGDTVASFARSFSHGVRQAGASVAQAAQNATNQVTNGATPEPTPAGAGHKKTATKSATSKTASESTEG